MCLGAFAGGARGNNLDSAYNMQLQAQMQEQYRRQLDQAEVQESFQQQQGQGAAGQPSQTLQTSQPFDFIKDKVWQLVELRIGYGEIKLNRQEMTKNNMGSVYIIQFSEEGVNGQAAPNRYFAQYAAREGKNMTLQPIVGTLMAGDINVGGLMENEYYWYLQRITRWDANGNTLDLYASPRKDEEIILRYRTE